MNTKPIRKIIFSISLIFAYSATNAQYVDIMPYAGYQFAANVDVYYNNTSPYNYGRLHFNPAGNYGLDIDVVLPYRDIALTLSFTNAQSDLTYRQNLLPETALFDVRQQYWMFGVSKEIDKDRIRPFGGMIFGWTTVNPDDPDNPDRNNVTKFTVGIRGGVKFFVTDRIGIFARARLLLPVQWGGGGIWFGGGGPSISLSTGTSIISGDAGAGIIISIGNK